MHSRRAKLTAEHCALDGDPLAQVDPPWMGFEPRKLASRNNRKPGSIDDLGGRLAMRRLVDG